MSDNKLAQALLGQYQTQLSPVMEELYQQEKARTGISDNDYNMRGYFQEHSAIEPLLSTDNIYNNGHYSDKYKMPNHMTFSKESQYNGLLTPNGLAQGGEWVQDNSGNWSFYATPFNLTQHSPQEMQNYFNIAEQGNRLILPQGYNYGQI